MANPLPFKLAITDPHQELERRLARAPREHAEALLVAWDLLQTAHQQPRAPGCAKELRKLRSHHLELRPGERGTEHNRLRPEKIFMFLLQIFHQ